MDSEVIFVIKSFIDNYLPEPDKNWPEFEFMRRCYARHAAMEILELVSSDIFSPADELIEEYSLEMMRFQHIAKNKEAELMFSTAVETAEQIFSCI